MLSGVGKIAGSLLLPLVAGASIGFIGGPIAGAIGLAVGGLITAGLSVGFLRLGKSLLEGGNAEERLGGMKDLATVVFPSMLEAMFTGKSNGTPAIENSKLLAATGETDITKARAQFASIHKGAVGFGKGIFNFGEGFATSASGVYNAVSEQINKILPINAQFDSVSLQDRWQQGGTGMGSLLGSIAGLIGALLEALIKGFDILIRAVHQLGTDISNSIIDIIPGAREKRIKEPYSDMGQAQQELHKTMDAVLKVDGTPPFSYKDFELLAPRIEAAKKTETKEDDKAITKEIYVIIRQLNTYLKNLVDKQTKESQSKPR